MKKKGLRSQVSRLRLRLRRGKQVSGPREQNLGFKEFKKIKYSNFYKKSYSTGAQDLIINYYFKEKQNGIYIDVGCFHPFKGNNTKLLYDKGWSGINIDLDFHTIELFEHIRKRDENIHAAI